MKTIQLIRTFGTYGTTRGKLLAVNSASSWKLTTRVAYYKTGSFLTDPNGVKTFVDLLGAKEQDMLMQELVKRRELILPVISKNDGSAPQDPLPTFKQCSQIAFHQSLPFIGFGFLDNFIMILAGEYIESTLGVAFGISTMAAAGLGNAISDVAGIGSAWYVETFAAKIGVAYPKLTPAQTDMVRTRIAVQAGRVGGIFLGCLIGMFPLLFS